MSLCCCRMSEKKKSRSGRRSRAISLSPTHNQQTAVTIEHLESLLRQKDEKIGELEEKLRTQETLLEHRLNCMERLQKERDELRKTNAALIEKTAELTRKQSVGSFGSPSRPPRVSRSVCGIIKPVVMCSGVSCLLSIGVCVVTTCLVRVPSVLNFVYDAHSFWDGCKPAEHSLMEIVAPIPCEVWVV